MKQIKKALRPFLKWKPLNKLAFWANNYYMAFEHRRRYPNDFKWDPLAPCPMEKYDASSAQIGQQFYVIGGYSNLNHVNSFVDVFDRKAQKWIERFNMPSRMAQSHLALTTDGKRYIYAASGQVGPQCAPAVRDAFVYDIKEKRWHAFPPLPEARYAAAMQLWRGRLHVMGGALPDRYTPSTDHWSIAVKEGKAMEEVWRKEKAMPRGAMHFPSAILNDELYIFGGQQGDYIPKPGCACFECDGNTQETYLRNIQALQSKRRMGEACRYAGSFLA
ncbi:MAG: hypothetical protein LW832_04165 [Parachlamydia sp.]|jgi:hypothetical protein|nr:hypothetical protein [Parachlamydia sp.]